MVVDVPTNSNVPIYPSSELGPIQRLNFPGSAFVTLSIVQNFNFSTFNTKVTFLDYPGFRLTLVKSLSYLIGLV